MTFFNPLNYLLTLEQAPEGLKNGQSFNTLLNPLVGPLADIIEYTIKVRPLGVEGKYGKMEGTLIFDIRNDSAYPLINYSSNIDHFLNGIKVRNVKIDAPFLSPGGGEKLRQSWKSNVTNLRNVRRVRYAMKGYVKGLNFNQNINISALYTVKYV